MGRSERRISASRRYLNRGCCPLAQAEASSELIAGHSTSDPFCRDLVIPERVSILLENVVYTLLRPSEERLNALFPDSCLLACFRLSVVWPRYCFNAARCANGHAGASQRALPRPHGLPRRRPSRRTWHGQART